MSKLAISEQVYNDAFGTGQIVAIDDQSATVWIPATKWEIKILPSLLQPVFGPVSFVGPLDVEPSPDRENDPEDSDANTENELALRRQVVTETKPAPTRRSRSRQLHSAKN